MGILNGLFKGNCNGNVGGETTDNNGDSLLFFFLLLVILFCNCGNLLGGETENPCR